VPSRREAPPGGDREGKAPAFWPAFFFLVDVGRVAAPRPASRNFQGIYINC
jgi:hypothetical protein